MALNFHKILKKYSKHHRFLHCQVCGFSEFSTKASFFFHRSFKFIRTFYELIKG
ncbi:hypothetical protein V6Z12_D04G011600 [Gossypium hirsutum]